MQYLSNSLYKLRGAVERLGGVAALSADFFFEGISESFTQLLGYAENEIAGRPLHCLDYNGIDSLLLKQIISQLQSGTTWYGDMDCKHKLSHSVSMRVAIAPSFDLDKLIVGYVAQYQPSHTADRAFQLSDVLYRYRNGFNRVAAFAVVSEAGVIQEVNTLFLELYGYSHNELIGKRIDFLQLNTGSHREVWKTLKAEDIWTGELECRHKKGSALYVRATAASSHSITPIHPGGSVGAFLIIHQDITKEIELRQVQKELAMESARQQLLRGTIHDIGNLQTSLLLNSNNTLQLAEGLSAAAKSCITAYQSAPADKKDQLSGMFQEIMRASSDTLLDSVQVGHRTVNDTIAILESWRGYQKNVRPVDDMSLESFIQKTLNQFALQAAQHHIGVIISAMPAMQVSWPVAQVQQIVFNLLINALQAIVDRVSKGELYSHRGRIDIAITQEGSEVSIGVTDNGGGFAVSIAQLFTPKYTTKKNGSGIGLHTSAILAQSMGGALIANNTHELTPAAQESGARFVLKLPQKVAPQEGGLIM